MFMKVPLEPIHAVAIRGREGMTGRPKVPKRPRRGGVSSRQAVGRGAVKRPGRRPAIRVLIGGGYPVLRAGLSYVLRSGGIGVVGATASILDLDRLARQRRPRIVVIDADSDHRWVEVAGRIKNRLPSVSIVVVTGDESVTRVIQAFGLGCSGFISKRTEASDAIAAMLAVARGQIVVEPRRLQRELSHFALPLKKDAPDDHEQLTSVERKILRLAADGRTNKEIAESLDYSAATIKHYMRRIIEKLDACDRTSAAVRAVKLGILA